MKKNVVIIILAILVLGLGCFIVYDKVINKDLRQGENNNIETKNYDLVKAKELVDQYYMSPIINFFGESDNELVKGYVAINYLDVEDIKNNMLEV